MINNLAAQVEADPSLSRRAQVDWVKLEASDNNVPQLGMGVSGDDGLWQVPDRSRTRVYCGDGDLWQVTYMSRTRVYCGTSYH